MSTSVSSMTSAERERYSRQILFSRLGERGQERLLRSRVAIVGCGALGSFQAAALARAGLGYLRLIDRDYVEFNNLQRQWLYEEADAREGMPKAVAAARAVGRINSGITVEAVVADLTPQNAVEHLSGVDLILDGSDNFEVRYLVNDFAVSTATPWIYGGAVGSYGLTMMIAPPDGACLRCVYPEAPTGAQPTCDTAGVLNTITSMVASLQVADAVRLLAGGGRQQDWKLTTVDVWNPQIRQVPAPLRSADCPCCGRREFVHLEGFRRAPISLCGRNAVQIHERARPVDLAELAERLSAVGEVRSNEFALRLFVTPYEVTVFPDGRAIIKGTQDVAVARTLYARYVGS